MTEVVLAPGVVCTRLGFGCAPILGSVDAKVAERAIAIALEEGIRHFDTAPSYGYGEGEAFLGRVLAPHRDTVTIATKFGIRAIPAARWLRPLKGLVRRVRHPSGRPRNSAHDGSRGPSSRLGDLFHQRVELTGPAMRQSLERSLRALRTDHVDILLLHEPTASLADPHGLRESALRLLEEGKIRSFGIAAARDQLTRFSDFIEESDILQYNPLDSTEVDRLCDRPSILFAALRSNPGVSPEEALSEVWNRYPKSVVLVSMFTEAHIRANAAALRSQGVERQ